MNVAVHRGCFFSFVAQKAPRILIYHLGFPGRFLLSLKSPLQLL
ncbi:hypothetical protein SAMN02744124_01753 [Paenibacillus barengoltzii J12]|uniref:Uncharacterized protein n=1 Tax=Paenibacillus barengoltzii J12 TaxID=935846 RepID=A0ABY1LWE1_9BACL|nr:hypothetical protein SAMN02744124_01753 [Paenibacillus barengoltzii J12]